LTAWYQRIGPKNMEFLSTLIHPRELVHFITTLYSGWLVYVALFAIVFAETGLLVGFFLPGDSLLFTIGVVCAGGDLSLGVVIGLLIAAAVIGDTTGYFLGRASGPRIFSRPKSRLFNPAHLRETQEFYAKHGGKTLIYARFVPIIRTFAPFVAGVGSMPYSRFISFSIFGGIGWITFMTLLGYGLGQIPIVQKYFDLVVLAIIALSLMPAAMQILKSRRNPATS
jgi:membrane-associated protein